MTISLYILVVCLESTFLVLAVQSKTHSEEGVHNELVNSVVGTLEAAWLKLLSGLDT